MKHGLFCNVLFSFCLLALFGRAGGLSITPESKTVSDQGGSFSLSISIDSNWVASTNVPWISLKKTRGSGISVLDYTVAYNPTRSNRVGNIIFERSVGSGTNSVTVTNIVTLTQTGNGCTSWVTLPTTGQMLSSSPGTFSFPVHVAPDVSWTVSCDTNLYPWISLHTTPGVGNGTVSYSVTTNADSLPRCGWINVKTGSSSHSEFISSVEINQLQTSYAHLLDASEKRFSSGGGEFVLAVSIDSYSFEIVPDNDWLSYSIDGKTVTFTMPPNTNSSSRTCAVVVRSLGLPQEQRNTLEIKQDAPASYQLILPLKYTRKNFTENGGADQFFVEAISSWCATNSYATNSCASNLCATADADWISFPSGCGVGVSLFSYRVSENHTREKRKATVFIVSGTTSKSFTVEQEPTKDWVELTEEKRKVSYIGGSFSFTVAASNSWDAYSPEGWIVLRKASGGKEGGNVEYFVEKNTSPNGRKGTITVTSGLYSQTFTLTQAPRDTWVEFEPAVGNVISLGGTNFSVSVDAHTNWTVSTETDWIILKNDAGMKKENIEYLAFANSSSSTRTGTIAVVSGLVTNFFAVVQAGNTLSSWVDFPNPCPVVSATGTNHELAVSSSGSCSWTAARSADDSWITILSPSGCTSNSLSYEVSDNPRNVSRSAIVTIQVDGAGETFKSFAIITQGGSGLSTWVILQTTCQKISAVETNLSFDVSAETEWTATTTNEWITLGVTNGTEKGSVTYTTKTNTTGSIRIGTISVKVGNTTEEITIEQAAQSSNLPDFLFSASAQTVSSEGGNYSFDLLRVPVETGACSVVTSARWVTLSTNDVKMGESVCYTTEPNLSTESRICTFTVRYGDKSETVTLTQLGECHVSGLSLDSNPVFDFHARGGLGTFKVDTVSSWTLSSSDEWIEIANPVSLHGTGNMTVQFTVKPNMASDSHARTGTISVVCQDVTKTIQVTQEKYISLHEALNVVGCMTNCIFDLDCINDSWFGQNKNYVTNRWETYSLATNSSWVTNLVTDNSSAAQSSELAHGESTSFAFTLKTVPDGVCDDSTEKGQFPGTLSFWWKTEGETNDTFTLTNTNCMEGAEAFEIFSFSGSTNEWINQQIDFLRDDNLNDHTSLRWTYTRNSDNGKASAWVDGVSWTPARFVRCEIVGPEEIVITKTGAGVVVPTYSCVAIYEFSSGNIFSNDITSKVTLPGGIIIKNSTKFYVGNGISVWDKENYFEIQSDKSFSEKTNITFAVSWTNYFGHEVSATKRVTILPSFRSSVTNVVYPSACVTNTLEMKVWDGWVWRVESKPDWITLSPENGTGSQSVTISLACNTELNSRMGTITFVTADGGPTPPLTNTVTVIQKGVISLNEALDNNELVFTNSVIPWFGQDDVFTYGGSSVQGQFPSGGESWFETTLEGPGTLSFYWACEGNGTHTVSFSANGQTVGTLDHAAKWTNYVFEATDDEFPYGTEWKSRWTYFRNDGAGATGWVDHVVWTPTGLEKIAIDGPEFLAFEFGKDNTITQYTCTATYSNGTTKTVFPVWSIANPNLTRSIDTNGVLTVGDGVWGEDTNVVLRAVLSKGNRTWTNDFTVVVVPRFFFEEESEERICRSFGGGGTVVLDIASNRAWTAQTTCDWITITQGKTSGIGADEVPYTVAANSNPEERVGEIFIVSGALTNSCTVTQERYLSLNEALDNDELVFTNSEVPWFGQETEKIVGGSSAEKGPSGESWFETTVNGPGTVSFSWKSRGDVDAGSLSFFVDDVETCFLLGTTEWSNTNCVISKREQCVLRWTCEGTNFSGWVDGVVWTPRQETVMEIASEYLPPADEEIPNSQDKLVYDGWLWGEKTVGTQTFATVYGTVQLKTAKVDKKGQSKWSASVVMKGAKKSMKGTATNGMNTAILTYRKDTEMTVHLCGDRMWGEMGNLMLDGAKNAFQTKNDQRAAELSHYAGVWTIVLQSDGSTGATSFVEGFCGLSVNIGSKGKTKVTGVLRDGKKVNINTQLIFIDKGDGPVACIPIFAQLYSGKKGSLSVLLWLDKEGNVSLNDDLLWGCSWDSQESSPYFQTVEKVYGKRLSGCGGESEFRLELEDEIPLYKETPVETDYLPTRVPLTLGSRWILPKTTKIEKDGTFEGDNPAGLKLTYTARSGLFKGTFSTYYTMGGKRKKVNATVNGVFCDGEGYGNAFFLKSVSLPVTVCIEVP